MKKIWKNNGTEEIGLVTPTPESFNAERVFISQSRYLHTDVESAESRSERRTNPSLEYKKLHR